MGACSQASETETDTDTDASDTHCASDQASETDSEPNAAAARTAGQANTASRTARWQTALASWHWRGHLGRVVQSTQPTETEPNS